VARVKSSDLLREISKSKRKNVNIPKRHVKFIVERYMEHAVNGMMNGYAINGCVGFYIKPGMIFFDKFGKTDPRRKLMSSRIFGYVFMPVCDNKIINDLGYLFRPAIGVISKMRDFSETDAIYKLLKDEET
jgi:hypothetical protein